jgi:2-keto-4-pentenoate hydratase/2-oxohepta-3-ene-1,7-dioic acid hydratase in catechol pathway
MGRRLAKTLGLGALAVVLTLAVAWATSSDPKGNIASFEQEELILQLAPLQKAITLAQVRRPGDAIATLLVTGMEDEEILAVDLSRATGLESADPFEVLAEVSQEQLQALATTGDSQERFDMATLLPAAPSGSRHIGTGTNFPEHAEEASSDAVFQFPKFGTAMPARSGVEGKPDVLLDYEVELCMRFDRTIASAEDFDAAVKGLFVCGDFTDRGKLIRLIDRENLDSGRGFSDGKSRADFFPSGALLVIPHDWKSFVDGERMTTRVNGMRRQDARGSEMMMDFRALMLKALSDMDRDRFLYDGAYYNLAPLPVIAPEMALMSGTAEGVIFTQPTRGDIIEGAMRWLFSAGWARGEGLVQSVIESFIANELASGHFLQPGDVVEHRSSHLGDIVIAVSGERQVDPDGPTR